MPKFVVIELNDESTTIELLSYCVKKNLERVSLLTRLEDHPYLRDDHDVVHEEAAQPENEGYFFQLSEEERQRLVSLISNTPGPQTLTITSNGNVQVTTEEEKHLLQQHQIPSTSAYSNNAFIYVKESSYKDEEQQRSNQFDQTVNSVAHGQAGLATLEMFSCNDSPSSGDILRRKTPSRKPEDSIKATCKVCGHDVMYSPQRTWNLMRHVWIMHQSSKPNQCSICGYAHIKPYVRKHIDSQHKHDPNAAILDLKSPELEAEWSQLLDQCFGVTYRKWKHHKEDIQHSGVSIYQDDELRETAISPSQYKAGNAVFQAGEDDFSHEHHFSPEDDLMTPL
uniref:LIn-26 Related n=1 Tax=Caenorhabditis tropicalis TaxID=1561998 RepID=A0A1I7TVX6_9PELO